MYMIGITSCGSYMVKLELYRESSSQACKNLVIRRFISSARKQPRRRVGPSVEPPRGLFFFVFVLSFCKLMLVVEGILASGHNSGMICLHYPKVFPIRLKSSLWSKHRWKTSVRLQSRGKYILIAFIPWRSRSLQSFIECRVRMLVPDRGFCTCHLFFW